MASTAASAATAATSLAAAAVTAAFVAGVATSTSDDFLRAQFVLKFVVPDQLRGHVVAEEKKKKLVVSVDDCFAFSRLCFFFVPMVSSHEKL